MRLPLPPALPWRSLCLTAFLLGSALAAPRMVFDGSRHDQPSVFHSPGVSQKDAPIVARALNLLGEKVCGTPRIVRQFQGAFAARTTETLYLIHNCMDVGAAMMPHRDPGGELLLLRSGRVIAHRKAFGDGLDVLPDLDGDGLQEFVSHMWFGPHMGEFARYSALHQFRKGALKNIMHLGGTYTEVEKYTLDGDPLPGTVTVRTLWADPQKPGVMQVIDYRSVACTACTNPERPYDPTKARRVLDLRVNLKFPPESLP